MAQAQDFLKQAVVERQKPQVVCKLQFGMLTGLDFCRLSHLNVTSKVRLHASRISVHLVNSEEILTFLSCASPAAVFIEFLPATLGDSPLFPLAPLQLLVWFRYILNT